MKKYPFSLLSNTKKWLGEDGIVFFAKNLLEHNDISPVLMDGDIPHPVHFREGMTVRNFLRKQPACDGWDSNRLDDEWIEIVKEAIAL